ncbi:MAG: hypothetical protein AAFY88_19740, partial [Acidobacteriota bacterium]
MPDVDPDAGTEAGRGELRVLTVLAALTGLFWLLGPASPWPLAGVLGTSPLLVVAGLGGAWLVARSAVVSRRLLASGCVLAALLAGLSMGFREHAASLDAGAARATIDRGYQRMWTDLEALAARMATELEPVISEQGRSSLFDTLRQLVEGAEHLPQLGVLLFDADGEAVSWYGAGLLHEPEAYQLPPSGRTYRRGFTASTALLVRPVGGERRPWRIVLGRSLAHGRFPFASLASPVRWSLGAPADSPPVDGVWRFDAASADGVAGPSLYVDPRPAPTAAPVASGAAAPWHGGRVGGWDEHKAHEEEEKWGVEEALLRLALIAVALLTAGCGLVAVTDREPSRLARWRRPLAIFACQLGALGLAAATGARGWTLLAVGLASAASAASLAFDRPRRRGVDAAVEIAGLWGLAVWGLFAIEARLGGRGSGAGLPVDGVWLALAVSAVLLVRLLAIAQSEGGASDEKASDERASDGRWLAVAFAALGAGAAAHDWLVFGLAGGVLGCAAAAWWWRSLAEPKTRPRRY